MDTDNNYAQSTTSEYSYTQKIIKKKHDLLKLEDINIQ